jgi:DNA-binding NarL/FixJ family response regulator
MLMNVRMPKMDGLEAPRAIKRERPQTSMLMLTSYYESPDYLLEAIQEGAAGYVLKEVPRSELLNAIQGPLRGDIPFDEALSKQLLLRMAHETKKEKRSGLDPPRKPPEERQKPSPLDMLTPKEIEVLRLLVQEQANKEIAKTLFISVPTVKKHIQQIFAKLGATDRAQAAREAVKLELHN